MCVAARVAQVALTSLVALSLGGCDNANLFTVEDDIELGAQLRDQIASDPDQYPLLDPAAYPEAYGHMDRMLNAVLSSGAIEYRDEFDWEIFIIEDDETLNAFAAPGGYMWYYTGLIKFLEHEDELVGVVGHEVAHIDRRHSTERLTQQYGIGVLLGLLLGEDPGLLAEISTGLASLQFSRADEREADQFSVEYLCDTDYAANGAAAFFEKLLEAGTNEPPEFLSTHPSSDERVKNINAIAATLGCDTSLNDDPSLPEWSEVVGSLP